MNIFVNLVPVIISVVALVVSIINLIIIKRNNISNVISNNRIKWMDQVRSLLEDFLEEYITDGQEVKNYKVKD